MLKEQHALSTKKLSPRVHEIRPSGIRRIFDLACASPDGIDLSIGDPDFDVPQEIKTSAAQAIESGFNRYVSTRGIPELREKLIAKLKSRKLSFDDILITAGATGGYFLAILATVGPGDEVLIPDPYFVAYANVVIMCGGVPRLIDTYPDFSLCAETIEPMINPKTRAIIINNPNNPTGIVYRESELRTVANLAHQHGVHLISDEIYDRFVFSGQPFVSVANVAEDAIVMSGFSKSAGMTGWRLGYVSGPREVIDAMATLQQYSYVCANSVAQKAAVTAMDSDLTEQIATYHRRRDKLYYGLRERFKIVKPEGAFYLFPQAPGFDADAFVERAIERKLFIIPGNVFSDKNTHFRISFAASDDKLDRAIAILNDLAVEFES